MIFAQVVHLATDDMAVEEQECREGLVPRRGSDLPLDGQMGEERIDLRFGHPRRVADVVEMDVPLDPMAVGLLGARAAMA